MFKIAITALLCFAVATLYSEDFDRRALSPYEKICTECIAGFTCAVSVGATVFTNQPCLIVAGCLACCPVATYCCFNGFRRVLCPSSCLECNLLENNENRCDNCNDVPFSNNNNELITIEYPNNKTSLGVIDLNRHSEKDHHPLIVDLQKMPRIIYDKN